MKKIILATVFGALLSSGSVMAAGVPGGDDLGDLTVSVKGYGHAGGMQALTDGIALDQEDSLDMVFRGKADDVFLPAAYSYQGNDTPKWMMQYTVQNGEGTPEVPVPGTILLLGSGLAGLVFIRRSSMSAA